jgi:hypothetical protein
VAPAQHAGHGIGKERGYKEAVMKIASIMNNG